MCFTFHLIKLSNFLKYFFYIFKKFYYFRIRFILSSLILKIVLFKKNEYFKIVTCPIFFYIYFYGIRVIFIDVFINKWNVTSNIYFKNRLKFLPEFLTRLFKIYINRKFWLSIWNCICMFFCHLYIKHFVDAPNANFLYSKKKKRRMSSILKHYWNRPIPVLKRILLPVRFQTLYFWLLAKKLPRSSFELLKKIRPTKSPFVQ